MSEPAPRVRPLVEADWPRVREIYAEGIATGVATFETEVPASADLDAKWIPGQRWGVDLDGGLVGWAAITPFSARECYRGVVETSVYVAAAAAGRGVGRALVDHQRDAALAAGLWTLQAAVFAENAASLALHRRAGYREVGRRERIAQRDQRWHDTVLLEYRAP